LKNDLYLVRGAAELIAIPEITVLNKITTYQKNLPKSFFTLLLKPHGG